MSKNRKTSIMTSSLLKRLTTMEGIEPECNGCGEKFDVGDKAIVVLSHRSRKHNHIQINTEIGKNMQVAKRYHPSCARMLNIWW